MAKRALIADDNPAVRNVIRMYLEQRGDLEICAEAGNGREAVDQALSCAPDLLILDVVMPELNGIEVATVLSKSLPQAKIILFTLYGDYVGNALASAAGVHIILPKPEGLASLIESVNKLLGPPGALLDSDRDGTNPPGKAQAVP
jgi:DNA-binding NarL/FixJ family response regulator